MYEKQGYLTTDYKLFYLCDIDNREYDFHYHDFYKLIVFIKGKVVYCIEGKNYELQPGDIVLVSKNEIHKPIISSECEYERFVIYLSDEFFKRDENLLECFDKALSEKTGVVHLPSNEREKILDKLKASDRKLKNHAYCAEGYARLWISESILMLNEWLNVNGLEFSGNVVYNKKIVDACDYINNHLKDDLSIDALSQRFYISKYHFMRLFKEHTGYSVHQYILEKRLIYTKRLTGEGMKITCACIEAGFKDYSTYLRASKKSVSSNLEI